MFPLCGPIYFLLIRASCIDDKKKVTHQELHGFADLNRNNSMFLPHKLNQCILCDNFQLLANCTLFFSPLLSENVLDIVWKETFSSRDKRLEQFATLEHLKLCCVMIWRRVVWSTGNRMVSVAHRLAHKQECRFRVHYSMTYHLLRLNKVGEMLH